MLALGVLLTSGLAQAVNDLPGGPKVNQLNLHDPVTQIGVQQNWLHTFMLVVCVVIFVAVFGVMFYSILKHRKSVGHKPANFHESVAVEIAWTIVPFVIVIAMGAMATRTVVAMKDTSNADLTIKATGYQWKWGYDYLKGEGEGIAFLSTLDNAHRLMSDAGKPVGEGGGDETDRCGACKTKLMINVAHRDVHGVVIRCGKCGRLNTEAHHHHH